MPHSNPPRSSLQHSHIPETEQHQHHFKRNESGFESGNESGFESGNESGFESGNESGFESGNESGFESGNESGFSQIYLIIGVTSHTNIQFGILWDLHVIGWVLKIWHFLREYLIPDKQLKFFCITKYLPKHWSLGLHHPCFWLCYFLIM